MIGAIEAGGTKFVCAVSDTELNIVEKVTIPTTSPKETLEKVFIFFDQYELSSIGIGSFGPININPNEEKYGYITSTPKRLWRNFDFLTPFKLRYNVPIGWNTDVNAAALGESELGSAKGKVSCVYITVGTGVGGGAVINGKPLAGYNHPEMGHFYLKQYEGDYFEGICDFHGNCLEGLVSGPAIEKRSGIKAELLPADHENWEIVAYYLAQAAMVYTTVLGPECIIFGGGVMNHDPLIEMIREKFSEILEDYLVLPSLDEYIIRPSLGNSSGILGSLLLGRQALS